MYNTWCFSNRFSGFLERDSHIDHIEIVSHRKIFRTAADRSATETMLLISSTEPNTANAVDNTYF